MRYSKSLAFALTVVVLLVVSCRAKTASSQKITVADLEKVKWIEGTWRGSGDAEKPFFERYRFENGSTLAVDNFTDETLKTVDDTTRFELKDGRFASTGEKSRWALSQITVDAATFVPIVGAKNTFVWQNNKDGSWKAVMDWPANEAKPAKHVEYTMRKMTKGADGQ